MAKCYYFKANLTELAIVCFKYLKIVSGKIKFLEIVILGTIFVVSVQKHNVHSVQCVPILGGVLCEPD